MKLAKIILLAAAALAPFGCDSVRDDAERTPIGSVISGKTSDTDTYLKRVSERNRSSDKDTWRPESKERF
ncbi:MAG: hypothetical protein IJI37_01890 [Opitutales bacterium]|nr:hypothetical protein [Opitutales bacterium]